MYAFPLDYDYETALGSKIDDIKQYSLDSEADLILATHFLNRIVVDTTCLHVDLNASRCECGLGILASKVTGLSVAWGVWILQVSS
ncbi:MAG: hypothetical protein ABIR84_03130 [Candidatus Nitrotoga sp.]